MFAGGRLVTIFSAPNYQNMMNDGCVLRVKKNVRLTTVNLPIPEIKLAGLNVPKGTTERCVRATF